MIISNAALNDNCMKWGTCDEQTLNCVIISFALTPKCSDEQNIKLHDYFFCVTSNCATRQLWWKKILSCVIIFSRYIKLFEVCHPPVVMNIKLHGYFSCYIKLFEVCHPPVVMIKILSCMIIFCASHKTVWGVPPASCDEQNIKLRDYFFPVTLKCLRCVTRQLWWTKY